MACTVVFNHYKSGLALTLELQDDEGNVVNGTPDAMVAPDGNPYRYEASVSEGLDGWYTAFVKDSIGVLHENRVKVEDDGGFYIIGDPKACDVSSVVSDIGYKQDELDDRFDELEHDAGRIIGDIAVVNADTATIKANSTTILARIGAWTGTGSNHILGALRSLFRKDGTVPSDIGGGYNPEFHSLEAIAENQPDDFGTVAVTDGKIAASASATVSDEAVNAIATAVRTGIGLQGEDAVATAGKVAEVKSKVEELAGMSGGDGARSVRIGVSDGESPIENVKVRVTASSESYLARTDSSGQAQFALDDATWQVVVTKPGYQLAPFTVDVSGDADVPVEMSRVAVPNADPRLVNGYLLCVDEAGDPEAGVEFNVVMTDPPSAAGFAYDASQRTLTSDNAGVVQIPGLVIGAQYAITRGDGNFVKRFRVGFDDPFPVPSFKGTP